METLVQTEISWTWAGPQRMEPIDFGYPVTFTYSVTVRLTFVVFREMSNQLLDRK